MGGQRDQCKAVPPSTPCGASIMALSVAACGAACSGAWPRPLFSSGGFPCAPFAGVASQAVREYRAIEGGPARLTRAREIDTEFVQEGSMRQVNLPSGLVAKFTTALAACESEAPVDIFDAASDEVFRLMERDTFSRFKSDPSALSNLVDGYYAAAAAASGSAGKKDGAEPDLITFRQFREWALKEPAVLIFFTGARGLQEASVGAGIGSQRRIGSARMPSRSCNLCPHARRRPQACARRSSAS